MGGLVGRITDQQRQSNHCPVRGWIDEAGRVDDRWNTIMTSLEDDDGDWHVTVVNMNATNLSMVFLFFLFQFCAQATDTMPAP